MKLSLVMLFLSITAGCANTKFSEIKFYRDGCEVTGQFASLAESRPLARSSLRRRYSKYVDEYFIFEDRARRLFEKEISLFYKRNPLPKDFREEYLVFPDGHELYHYFELKCLAK